MAAPVSSASTMAANAASEEKLLKLQEAAYAQQEKIATESAIAQSKHDTMMQVIKAIAS
ncbi:MAG TPA: hypothetical protein VH477_15090 [Bryobacteraceae bacterium]|jgi:hypothetical protein